MSGLMVRLMSVQTAPDHRIFKIGVQKNARVQKTVLHPMTTVAYECWPGAGDLLDVREALFAFSGDRPIWIVNGETGRRTVLNMDQRKLQRLITEVRR